jgi:hypothetical protein
MSIQSALLAPQNDHQLNIITASFNAAYNKYFDAGISEKRSNKLRDCICEGLGFTNGAYQELQAYWAAQESFDFSNPDFMVAIVSERLGGYQCVVPKTIATSVVEFLCTYFPQDNEQLLTEEELPDGQMFDSDCEHESYGWEILYLVAEHKDVIEIRKAAGDWFPLYYGTVIIGFVFSKEEADIMNGMLRSAAWGKILDITDKSTGMRQDLAVQVQWDAYINCKMYQTELPEGKYVSLRRDGMDNGLMLKFDSAIIDENKLIVRNGSQTFEIHHKQEGDIVVYNGLEFDFINFYNIGPGSLSMTYEERDLAGNPTGGADFGNIDMIEWFPKGRIEYRPNGADELASFNNLEGAEFLVK